MIWGLLEKEDNCKASLQTHDGMVLKQTKDTIVSISFLQIHDGMV